MGVFAEFLKERKIIQKTLRLVSFVEVKNSTMGRGIGYLMDEGFTWTQARTKAIQKMNNIKCRITNTRPIDVYNRKVKLDDITQKRRALKVTPLHKPVVPYSVFKDKKKKLHTQVRFMKKQAQDKSDQFYKSYQGQKRKSARRVTQNWSVPSPN